MSVVVSFENFTPAARFDSEPWAEVRIEESATSAGPWATVDTIALSPLDPDPAAPASRSFSTSEGTAADQWYRVVFVDANAGESEPSLPLQNRPAGTPLDSTPYASADELARILKIRQPTTEQTAAMTRALEAAAIEINAELDRTQPFDDPVPSLVVQVNLDRALELWQQSEATLGFVGLGSEAGPARIASNTWEKHAIKLAPLKEQWGLA